LQTRCKSWNGEPRCSSGCMSLLSSGSVKWCKLLTYIFADQIMQHWAYLVPDSLLEAASNILSDIGLPLTPAPKLLVESEGDFYAKARLHRITRSQLHQCPPSNTFNYSLFPSPLFPIQNWRLHAYTTSTIPGHSEAQRYPLPNPTCRVCLHYPHYASLPPTLRHSIRPRIESHRVQFI
jgi:hypothetical protein